MTRKINLERGQKATIDAQKPGYEFLDKPVIVTDREDQRLKAQFPENWKDISK